MEQLTAKREKIGVERANQAIQKADFVIFVVDSSREMDSCDDKIISLLSGKKSVCLLNKSDLNTKVTPMEVIAHFEGFTEKPAVIKTSANNGDGKTELISYIKNLFFNGEINFNDETIVSNLRQKDALCQANEALNKVIESIDNNMPEDFLSIDLLSSYASLGEIIGEEVSDDLVDKIFSEFCMGK